MRFSCKLGQLARIGELFNITVEREGTDSVTVQFDLIGEQFTVKKQPLAGHIRRRKEAAQQPAELDAD